MTSTRSQFQIALIAVLVWVTTLVSGDNSTCPTNATRLHLSDPPYENYFYSDCHSSSHVIVTSPLSTSNLTLIGPRLLIAWPAGNSGVVSFFKPENGENGTLGVQLENSTTTGEKLDPIYLPNNSDSGNPRVGVSGYINFNSSAVLTVPILGSIRTIRDFTEGPSIIYPSIQESINFFESSDGGASLNRTWLDNATTTYLEFTPVNGSESITINRDTNTTLHFGAGIYQFNASFNYPQLEQLSPEEVLNNVSSDLIQQNPDQATSLSFLSYTDKLLAGTWRFLTYFGRDSMISLLLLQPILSEGEGGAIEAVIGAVLERINRTDGTACHEEVIGDYATWLNIQKNISSTAPQCDYKMVDTDYFLPIVMRNYLVDTESGRDRASAFLNTTATFLSNNTGLTYSDLAQLTAEKIMNTSAPFASPGGQTKDNLIHLKEGEVVGEWRDSQFGIGGGRIPYDVNTALVPAALRSIAALSKAGFFPAHPDWNETANQYAEVWEDETLKFFEVSVPKESAVPLVESYVHESSYPGPSNTDSITSDVTFYGLALDGNNNQSVVKVLNTDDCFRHFLLNTTNQTQLSLFLNQSADHILQPFPVGLSTSVGLFVANPAYGGDPVYAKNFTNAEYHGTVVWSWQLAMMAAGLAHQLGRCESSNVPDFCNDDSLHRKVLSAYKHLWDLIDNNSAQLSGEVWSWTYNDGFKAEPLGAFTPTESDIRQLWSLTFLAIHRENFEV
ncbi:glycogen debranching enzyme [Zopfia rhizophila CBS 207.26]|uniref:Glycogen debranching enzyme n=1 Tax=Zopfia rhizophila CBS 207.26 TaxID=1314779 RepID=A0A6A6DU38_9PEZI|nr:glycogen debranching enzyme [Zopfia rhizophila CBS 207.26]